MVYPHRLPVLVGIAVQGRAVGAEGETVAPFEHAEIVVIGMVFLHQNHDVVDAGQAVAAGRPVRKRKGSRTARVCHPYTVTCASAVMPMPAWPGWSAPPTFRVSPREAGSHTGRSCRPARSTPRGGMPPPGRARRGRRPR